VAGDRDPTRPEYVVSDMLRPLPELDWNFDTADEAAGGVHCAVSPVTDSQSHAVGAGREDGDAASHVLASDDSLSSGNECSPGGFRKRHSMSPFHARVDKKLLQVPEGCGHSLRHSAPAVPPFHVGRGARCRSSSDAEVGRSPLFNIRGRGLRREPANCDGAVSSAVVPGRGRAIHGIPSNGTEVSRPSCIRPVSAIYWLSDRDSSSDTSVDQPQLDSDVDAAASEDDMWGDTGQRRDTRQMKPGFGHCLHGQRDGRILMSSAAGGYSTPPGEHQCLPTPSYLPPRGLRDADEKSKSDVGGCTGTSSAGASAADVGRDSSSARQWKTVHRGRCLVMYEDSDDTDVGGHADAPVDTDVKLIQLEPTERCAHPTF